MSKIARAHTLRTSPLTQMYDVAVRDPEGNTFVVQKRYSDFAALRDTVCAAARGCENQWWSTVRVCVWQCACVRACVRACVCVCAYEYVRLSMRGTAGVHVHAGVCWCVSYLLGGMMICLILQISHLSILSPGQGG